jgi:hypothetical protein
LLDVTPIGGHRGELALQFDFIAAVREPAPQPLPFTQDGFMGTINARLSALLERRIGC